MMAKLTVTRSVCARLPSCCFDFVIESFPQILMHGSSVSAFASRIMELQAKDFFSRFVCFLVLQIPPFIRDLSLLIAPVQWPNIF